MALDPAKKAEFQNRLREARTRTFAKRALKPGETIIASCKGWIGEMMGRGANRQYNGVLILTDQRIVFYRKFLLVERIDAIPLDRITSIDRSRGMHGQLIVHAASAILHFKTFQMAELDGLHAELEKRAGIAPQLVRSVGGGLADELEKLAALKDKGLLTAEEFAAQKAKLLAS